MPLVLVLDSTTLGVIVVNVVDTPLAHQQQVSWFALVVSFAVVAPVLSELAAAVT